MKEDNNSGNPKIENFLEASMESYPNFWFKSPPKHKNSLNLDSLVFSWKQTPVMSPMPAKFGINNWGNKESSVLRINKSDVKMTPLKEAIGESRLDHNSADKAK